MVCVVVISTLSKKWEMDGCGFLLTPIFNLSPNNKQSGSESPTFLPWLKFIFLLLDLSSNASPTECLRRLLKTSLHCPKSVGSKAAPDCSQYCLYPWQTTSLLASSKAPFHFGHCLLPILPSNLILAVIQLRSLCICWGFGIWNTVFQVMPWSWVTIVSTWMINSTP